MRRACAILLALAIVATGPWPSASAAATASPAFPSTGHLRVEAAPEFATWLFDRMEADPAPTRGDWDNLTPSGGAFSSSYAYTVRNDSSSSYARLEYTAAGYLRGGWMDVKSAMRASSAEEAAIVQLARAVASRLGVSTDGAAWSVYDNRSVTFERALPWGDPVDANSLYVRVDLATLSPDRVGFTPWFNASGTPTVSAAAAEQTAFAAATAHSPLERITVRSVGASVVNQSVPVWAVMVFEGNCSGEIAYYFIDAETGVLLGRRGDVFVDAVCPLDIRTVALVAAAIAAAAVVGVALWRRRAAGRRPADVAPPPPGL